MLYKLRIDVTEDENGVGYLTYGIDVYRLERTVPDVFTDRNKAAMLIDLCKQLQPDPEHLNDVILEQCL